jgi:hypothetical protein
LINKGFLNTNRVITNGNRENARSRKEASSMGKPEYGDKGRWVKYWALLGCWISPFYGPLSLGAHFETYKQFISLIFQFFFQAMVNHGYWISGYGGMTVFVLYCLTQIYDALLANHIFTACSSKERHKKYKLNKNNPLNGTHIYNNRIASHSRPNYYFLIQ